MSAPIKELNEHFARAKNYYGRLARGYTSTDLLRCLASLAHGLKILAQGKIVGATRQSSDNVIHALVQRLNKIEQLKTYMPQGFAYNPKAAKRLLVDVVTVARKLKEEGGRETPDAMRARKLKIDKCLSRGGNLLSSKPVEADEELSTAASLYVDEHLLFRLIAHKYAMVERWDKAAFYIKRALEVTPDDETTYTIAMDAFVKTGDEQPLLEAMKVYFERFGEADAKSLMRMALLYQKFNRPDEAKDAARKVLAKDPSNIKARRIVTS